MLEVEKKISIIISVYNEEENLPELLKTLVINLDKLFPSLKRELICVNDSSTDDSLAVLEKCRRIYQDLVIINLTRNFGHEIAMQAGLDYASGDACIFMDGDMQNPPDIVMQMIKKWLEEGFEVVLSKRKEYKQTMFKKITSFLFYKILNLFSDVKFDPNFPDFRLITKKYTDRIKKINERRSMFRGILNWIGITNYTIVEFDVPDRAGGKSSYNIFRYFNLGIDALLQFSIKPLRVFTVAAVCVCVLSILFAFYTIFEHYFFHKPEDGFTTIVVVNIMLFSMQIFVMAVIGEYVGRIHIEVKKRPLYFSDVIKNTDTKVNIENEKNKIN